MRLAAHRRALAVVLAFVTAGCSNSSGSGVPGSTADASASDVDSGQDASAASDAGAPPAEGGASGGDGGGAAWAGTIGSGSVPCYVDAGTCAPHQACCDANDALEVQCVSTYDACTACANGACPIQGCGGPADCPGQACCALVDSSQFLVMTGCKASCDLTQDEYVVCKAAADCPGQESCHDIFGNGFGLQECGD